MGSCASPNSTRLPHTRLSRRHCCGAPMPRGWTRTLEVPARGQRRHTALAAAGRRRPGLQHPGLSPRGLPCPLFLSMLPGCPARGRLTCPPPYVPRPKTSTPMNTSPARPPAALDVRAGESACGRPHGAGRSGVGCASRGWGAAQEASLWLKTGKSYHRIMPATTTSTNSIFYGSDGPYFGNSHALPRAQPCAAGGASRGAPWSRARVAGASHRAAAQRTCQR